MPPTSTINEAITYGAHAVREHKLSGRINPEPAQKIHSEFLSALARDHGTMSAIFRTICIGISIALLFSGFCSAQEHPKRYISLAPSTTEILFALGLDDEIVGVSTYCNRPAAAAGKEKVGDFSRPNIEKILALKPDYVFCTGLEQDPVIGRLRQLHIPIYVADPGTIQELIQTITDIGNLTGRGLQAQKIRRREPGILLPASSPSPKVKLSGYELKRCQP